jgi:hypothetical protein
LYNTNALYELGDVPTGREHQCETEGGFGTGMLGQPREHVVEL